ncbi:MAG: hypothetical protein ABL904_24685 [Hyphomicrobiaceae bacterium]
MAIVIAVATKTRLNLSLVQARLARIRRTLLSTYRPEQHYMRGPGPKSRQKQAGRADF